MKQLNWIAFLFLLVLIGCTNQEDTLSETTLGYSDTWTTIEYSVMAKGVLSGNGAEGIIRSNRIIRNANEWQSLMDQMNSVNVVTEEFNETAVDFDDHMLIAVFLEVKGSGYEVEIDDIQENDTTIRVSTLERSNQIAVVAQPYCIVKILKTDKTIVFE